jgi:ribosomal protein S18 acetylase RimI-like enzyme
MEVKRAIEFDDSIREKICRIFVDVGFKNNLEYFSKSKNKLIKAFSHIFLLKYFFIAQTGNEIVGIAACVDNEHDCIKHNKNILKDHLGIIKGTFANIVFNICSVNFSPKYPIEPNEKTASIEYVAISSKHRKMGVGTALIEHILALSEYNNFILEVEGTNINALKLYEKLGFKEIFRSKQIFPKFFKTKFQIYMKYTKNTI